ncbi:MULTISPECIES: DivIVA-like cell division protein Wag31 [Gordonia]|uniref:Cell wall synthesis protein Wag31 n=2 Tax=Gordonia terrae TaxID=2055 RepID=A0A2I1RBS1_9ACTN|nr:MULTISPECIES: DivIVA domain-containing protein [Gordonia]VTR07539.1 cell-division initiation protein [Clostridioides difficile]ANY23996.1 cell wall synthesis protein [Gordonia terrae]AWO84733.1 DivIVA domain-containing protein [Gordonia terrae]PKZ66535.1 DivIVA domain-containing protein [Gordonia terrae]UPW07396.1 DivIVA domain-containing protein [Gordonia terrae]
MRLTPADVHNVAFSKPPIGKRGYNEDEVDQFLDFVEAELARLIEENTDLKQRVEELEGELADARSGAGSSADDRTQMFAKPAAAPEPPAPAPTPAPQATNDDANVRAARVLALAQDTADRLTGSARADADAMLSDAQTRADTMVSEAQTKSDAMLADARQRSEAILADAQTRSEAQLRQAQERADALQSDAERKHSEIMGTINQQRGVLEGRIEQLKTFEREYRTRLKTYLESQLEELQQRGSAAPVEGGRPDQSFSNDPGNGGFSSYSPS